MSRDEEVSGSPVGDGTIEIRGRASCWLNAEGFHVLRSFRHGGLRVAALHLLVGDAARPPALLGIMQPLPWTLLPSLLVLLVGHVRHPRLCFGFRDRVSSQAFFTPISPHIWFAFSLGL